MKLRFRKRKKTASVDSEMTSFELLTDYIPQRICGGCGLIFTGYSEMPFEIFDGGEPKPFEIMDFRFCPKCGKPLRTPQDLLPGYVPEWME